jgi:hypothetical protein
MAKFLSTKSGGQYERLRFSIRISTSVVNWSRVAHQLPQPAKMLTGCKYHNGRVGIDRVGRVLGVRNSACAVRSGMQHHCPPIQNARHRRGPALWPDQRNTVCGRRWSLSFHESRPDAAAKLSANTRTPVSICSGDENSSGRWLTPPRQGMKIMAVGQICAMKSES